MAPTDRPGDAHRPTPTDPAQPAGGCDATEPAPRTAPRDPTAADRSPGPAPDDWLGPRFSGEERRAALALWCVDGLGTARYRRLLAELGSPRAIVEAGPVVCANHLGRPGLAESMARRWPSPTRIAHLLEALGELDITPLQRADPFYPTPLAELGEPEWIFVRGALDALQRPLAAVVGTRSVGREGLRLARDVVRWCGARGWHIVSGGALGVDGEAHRQALAMGLITVAVLPAGLGHLVPRRHKKLLEAVVEGGGCLVSEHPPWRRPAPRLFARRNRLISGLSAFAVVVRAAARSGALITADWARRQGRPVYAVPGSPDDRTARGCLDALRRGAHLLTSPADLPAARASAPPPARAVEPGRVSAPPSGVAGRILKALDSGPLTLEELASLAGAGVAEVMPEITSLLLAGYLEQAGPGRYRLGPRATR